MFGNALSIRRGHCLAGVLLLVYVALALSAVRHKSTTYDEVAHMTGGRAYWKFGDFRVHPENGALPQRWVALPAVLSGDVRFPGPEHPSWRLAHVFPLGDTYFHDLGNPLDEMLFAARAAAVLFGVGVGVQVYLWGRFLWGSRGGLLALGACVLCPTMLAHGPLATSDMCLTCFLLASVTAVWAVLQRVSWPRLLGCVLALGGLILSKNSGPIVVAMAAALVLVRLLAGPPLVVALGRRERTVESRWGRLAVAAGAAAVCAVGTVVVVWANYEFRYAAMNTTELPPGEFSNLGKYQGSLVGMAEGAPEWANALQTIDRHRLLPQAYTFGVAYILASRQRPAFLRGEYSLTGWPEYFPYCFLVKTPLPLFGLLVLALAAVVSRGARSEQPAGAPAPPPLWYRSAPLWVLWAMYWALAVNHTVDIGHRYVLPTYPPLYIFAGAAARWIHRPLGRPGWVVVGLCVWSVAEAAQAFPHYLAYFNPLVSRQKAHTVLVESNLDWGQDLPLLRDRLAAEPQPVYLDYFGSGRPSYYGIRAIPLSTPPWPPDWGGWRPGVYCISATNLSAVYAISRREWDAEKENNYRVCLQLIELLRTGREIPPQFNAFRTPAGQLDLLNYVVELQYTRLLIHLRSRRPDDTVGFSILIYKLQQAEIQDVLFGRPKSGPLAAPPRITNSP